MEERVEGLPSESVFFKSKNTKSEIPSRNTGFTNVLFLSSSSGSPQTSEICLLLQFWKLKTVNKLPSAALQEK